MIAGTMAAACQAAGAQYVFKASYDKANRTSLTGRRGLGIEAGLRVLEAVRAMGLPVLTDVHDAGQAREAAKVVDVIQIPAFLCRQTDLLVAAGETGVAVNIKKGQFMAPWDMRNAVEKVVSTGNENVLVTERGTTFGYNNLVVDFRGLPEIRESVCPVVFDATHSVQLPGGMDGKSGGQREFVPVLARAAMAVGISGIFMETHPDPSKALSDGPNAWPLPKMEALLTTLLELDRITKKHGFLESTL
jgi:2-dehydro-3-deoxyphosphooctonate aldolase (KDO 8-P synthase)